MLDYVQRWEFGNTYKCPVCGSAMIEGHVGPMGGFTEHHLTCTSDTCHWTGSIHGEQKPDISKEMNETWVDDGKEKYGRQRRGRGY